MNSHPHSTPRVSIVHNGIIENYGILKERLIAKGYTFESETDTEVFAHLIEEAYAETHDLMTSVREDLERNARGVIAAIFHTLKARN